MSNSAADNLFARPPIIIIGAPRSGTNMLRDALASLPGLGTWPCDELNYVWRHGNSAFPTDELTAEHVNKAARRCVRRAFHDLARRRAIRQVVEKTCANSLRIEFVRRIVPEAKFILLVRNGLDAAASASKCWRSPPRLEYVLRKARYIPPTDFVRHGLGFARSQVSRVISGKRQWPSWGPRFAGMEELLRTNSLAEVCAVQWARCVERARAALREAPVGDWVEVRYEDFVQSPRDALAQITRRLEIPATDEQLRDATHEISPHSIGKWRKTLDDATARAVRDRIEPLLLELGYVGNRGAATGAEAA